MACPRIDDYEVSEHAQWAMTRRGILWSDVEQVLQNPDQSEVVQPGRCVYQSKIVAGASSTVYLLRVFGCRPGPATSSDRLPYQQGAEILEVRDARGL